MPASPLHALLDQPDLSSARDTLAQNPELLNSATVAVVRTIAAKMTDRAERERLAAIESLIEKALHVGLDAAFESVTQAAPRRLHLFELMSIGSQFLEEPDERAARALLESYPEIPLDAVRVMATSALKLSSEEERQRLERRIAILDQWPMIRLARAAQRAQAAEAQFQARRDVGTLRQAAEMSDAVAAAAVEAPVDAGMRASILVHAMELHVMVWMNTFDIAALDRAVERGLEAERQQPGSGGETLGASLVQRYEARGTADDLDQAIRILTPMVPGDQVPADDDRVAGIATTLANALRHRFMVSEALEELQRAIHLYEQLASLPGAAPERRRIRQLNLSAGLATRYDSIGDLHDLDRAIAIMREASVSMADTEPAKATLENDLGLALLKRFGVTRQRQDLADALGAANASIRLLKPGAPEVIRNLTNCGICYLAAYRELKKPEMLAAAIDALLQVVEWLPPEVSEAARPLGMASEALLERYRATGSREDIDRAVSLAERAVAATGADSALRSGALGHLAGALRLRSASPFAQPDDVAGATQGYRDALAESLAQVTPLAVEQSLQWSGWARERREWNEASEGLMLGLEAQQKLLDSQQDRASRELRLKRVQGLGAMAADSLMRAGQLEGAVVAFERGRALLMAQALRQRPEAVTFLSIAEKVPERPVVYLEDVDGGYALIVHHGKVRAIELPELREETLNTWLAEHIRLREEDPAAWNERLTGLCRWLWDAAIGRLIEALESESRIVLVPGGYLGMLPLHAAWTDDPTTPTGRRYAIDSLTIQYAPRVGALRTDPAGALRRILCVDEPKPVKAPTLPFSKAEVTASAALFEGKTILRGRKATAAALLEQLNEHDVVHLSCHGAADLDEPLENGFLLAGNEFLTLRHLLERRLEGLSLAVLSACDTGQMGAALPDEAISLPAGLLQAGVRTVVSPLWPVDSWSTLLAVVRFYEALRHGGLEPPEALATAQRWLRDTTNAEKAAHFKGVPAIYRELLLRDPDLREQSAIVDWAPFSCCGG